MKFIYTLLIYVAIVHIGNAQSKKEITVVPSHAQVQLVDREGMQVLIELDRKFVEKTWLQKLKTFGKVETEKESYIIHGASIPEISSSCTLYSTVFTTKTGTVVFWAIDLGSQYVTQGHDHYEKAKKKLHTFAKEIYVADVNVQIAAAEDALNASSKSLDKLVKQGESLNSALDKNAKDKVDLQRKLEDNNKELKFLESEEVRIEGRMKEVKSTENTEEQQKLLKESISITNNVEKTKQQKVSLETKIKDNENQKIQLESDIKKNAENQVGAKDEVDKMAKAVDAVRAKLKIYE